MTKVSVFPSPSGLGRIRKSLLARLCAMRCQGTAKWTLSAGTCERQKKTSRSWLSVAPQTDEASATFRFFLLDDERSCVYSTVMAMDPVRLARIRARVLAAAAVAVPAVAGCSTPHVNERPREHVNVAPPDEPPSKEKEATPINERKPDQPAPELDKPREPDHVNTPAPDTTAAIPPPGQTIPTAQPSPLKPPSTINTVSSPPKNSPAKAPTPDHVNTPPPLPNPTSKPPQPKHINTPEPPR